MDSSSNPGSKRQVVFKLIYKRPSIINENKGKVYCSQECYGLSCRKEIACPICQKPILAGLNKKTCSRNCANKFRTGIKYKLNQPKDKVKNYQQLKIRLIALKGAKCEKCGYNIPKILQVHHKDRNRQNNDLSNLELICPNCHCEEHHL